MTASSLPSKTISVVIPAAGQSRRFGGPQSKIFSTLAGRPVWCHAVQELSQFDEVVQFVIAINPSDRARWEGEFASEIAALGIELVDGGEERYDSVRRAIAEVREADFIAVHDAARPLVQTDDLQKLFAAADHHDAVMLANPVRGTIKRTNADETVLRTIDRSNLWEAQTPQMFRRELIVSAYARWRGWPITDDAGLVERAGHPVQLIEGSPLNIKITSQEDLQLAEAIYAMKTPGS